MTRPGGGLEENLEVIAQGAREAGRDPADIAFEGRIEWATGDLDKMAQHAERWRAAGASSLSVNTMGARLDGVDAHITAMGSLAGALL